MDKYYIDGDSYMNEISTFLFFKEDYYLVKYLNMYSTSENKLINEKNINKINTNEPLIFITKVEELDNFYKKIVKYINNKFILITHYGDKEAGLHNEILNHPLLVKWYGQNMYIISDKTIGIPIGLENKHWKRTNIDTIKQHSTNSKEKLLYLNFSLRTNLNRKKIMKKMLNMGFEENAKLDWNDYIEDLSRHKFCISPKGNGVDCHRTWECLYLGVIPIVEKSIPMSYFNDLPILFVDNYDIITREYLNKIYIEFQKKTFNMDKISLLYWKKDILDNFNV
jgi:hypothetical protein